jgi:radical SAM superfamily enzyme YgiQ (UPF0313 family)
MRVLLINSNLRDDLLAAPPIGLCYVATAAEAGGHEVRVLDLCFQRSISDALKQAAKDFSPEVIGISLRNIDNVNMLHPVSYLPDAVNIVRTVREISDAPIVVGGSGASLSPHGVLNVLNADFIVVSEGERSFVELLKSIADGTPSDTIPGVGSMRDGQFHLTAPKLEGFPSGNPEVGKWVDLKKYSKMGGCYNVQSKRGCAHRCVYCTYNQTLEGHILRLRSPVEVVDEIEEALHKYKPEYFEFVDSMFNEPKSYCVEILEEIARRPWKARFTAMGMNPRNLDRAFMDLLWRVGFTSFQVSPESASEVMIRNYGKNLTLDDMIETAEAVAKTRFTVLWHFLIGGPGETNETLQETVNFVLKHLNPGKHPPYHIANFWMGVRLYPGTKLWDIALNEGFITEESDPTEQLWYLSDELDLNRAVNQLVEAASKAHEIVLGFDERYLEWSWLLALFCKVMRKPKPYWRQGWGLNSFLLWTGLRFMSKQPDVPGMLRCQLQRQGYRGPHVEALSSPC